MAYSRQQKKVSNSGDLCLVRDAPAFEDSYEKTQDTFNHHTYAGAIARILSNNIAPLVIGLLGPWGCGKSTILNILMTDKHARQNYKFIYFNAWKYSDDSFRRQFLIECIDSLIEDDNERERLKKQFARRFISAIKKEVFSWKDLFKMLRTDKTILVRIGVALFITVLIALTGMVFKNLLLSLSSIFTALIILILTEQIPKLIQLNIPVNPQLVLPEQFEKEFRRIIEKACKQKRFDKLIFIIDDVDRCPSHMIMDILDSVKNFLAPCGKIKNRSLYDKCYYIIAIDDNAVIAELKKQRSTKYEVEEILKFFDATVRLGPLQIGDLIGFSKSIAKQTQVPEDVVSVAIYGGFDTPRKIKHFLNAYKITYHTAVQRYNEGLFPFNPNNVSSTIAKSLIMQIVFPKEFQQLLNNALLLDEWEDRAEAMFESVSEIREEKQNFPSVEFLRFLWITRDIRIDDISSFLHFKLPEWAVKLPQFSFLKNAIVQNLEKDLSAYLKKIGTNMQKEALVELLRDLLDFGRSRISLGNILASGIMIYQTGKLPVRLMRHVSDLLLRYLVKYRTILTFEPKIVFDLAKHVKQTKRYERKLIELGVIDLTEQTNASYATQFINILHELGFTL